MKTSGVLEFVGILSIEGMTCCKLILGLHILEVALCLIFFELAIMVINSKKIVIEHELNQVVK